MIIYLIDEFHKAKILSLLKFKELIHVLLVFIWKTMLFLLLSLNHSLIWDLRKAYWNKRPSAIAFNFSSIVTKISYIWIITKFTGANAMIGQGPQGPFWSCEVKSLFKLLLGYYLPFSFSFSQTVTVELSEALSWVTPQQIERQKLTDYSFY